jgi:predicted outer membrane repeat protein
MRPALLLLLVHGLSVAAVSARTWHIFPNGSGDAPTIQAGIDSAVTGDTVELAAGTYLGSGNKDVDYMGKPVTVRSASGNPEDCFIDCEATVTDRHRAFVFQSQETEASRLEGVTIRNGWGPNAPPLNQSNGGAIYCNRASPTIENCVFENNHATNGAAIYLLEFSHPELMSCSFTENPAGDKGGGIYLFQNCYPTVADCEFIGNTAGNGGGVCADEGSFPTFVRCVFADNRARVYGGGVYCRLFSPAVLRECSFVGDSARHGGGLAAFSSCPEIRDCAFTENRADLHGGGVHCESASHASVEGCLFRGNESENGGGLACWSPNSAPRVSGSRFLENRAVYGGGIWASASSPGIIDCILTGNYAGDLGGGIMCTNGGAPVVERSLVAWNEALRGGGLACWPTNSDATVVASTFYGNTAPNGSELYCRGSWLEVERTIVVAGVGSEAVRCVDPTHPPTFTCVDVFGHPSGDWVGCIEDQSGINGDFSADPLFCDAPAGDFTLRGDSPCLPGQHPDGFDCGLIGAFGEGCTGPTAVEHTSWGGVKAMFR